MVRFRYWLLVSAVLHAEILSLSFKGGDGKLGSNSSQASKNQGEKHKGMDVKVLAKERPTEVTLTDLPKTKDDVIIKKKKVAKNADIECPGKWFGGVGVTITMYGLVIEVHKGYPADLADLQAGDMIVDINDKELMGTPGTTVTVLIERKKKRFNVTITRGKICY